MVPHRHASHRTDCMLNAMHFACCGRNTIYLVRFRLCVGISSRLAGALSLYGAATCNHLRNHGDPIAHAAFPVHRRPW